MSGPMSREERDAQLRRIIREAHGDRARERLAAAQQRNQDDDDFAELFDEEVEGAEVIEGDECERELFGEAPGFEEGQKPVQ